MNRTRILIWAGLAAVCAGPAVGEPLNPPAPLPAAVESPAEHWQYHEKWDKAQQRGTMPATKGAAPATECRAHTGPERGTIRPAPVPGRCPENGVRVRT